jgi:hypothetical protein
MTHGGSKRQNLDNGILAVRLRYLHFAPPLIPPNDGVQKESIMEFALIFKESIVAVFRASNKEAAASVAKKLMNTYKVEIEGATKKDFHLREVKTPMLKKPPVKVVPSNPKYKSKYAPVRVKPPRAVK